MNSQSVGVIGLGNMGLALATRLSPQVKVVGYDLDPARSKLAARAGVELASDVAEVARGVEVLLFSLPRPDISKGVLETVLPIRVPGRLIIETSTVGVDDVLAMHAQAKLAGTRFVDAAILSGVDEVSAGTSCFLIGGDTDDVVLAEATLTLICRRVMRLGPPGSGMAAKIINNGVAHAIMVVLAEAAALGAASGIELADLCKLLDQDDAGVKRPLTARLSKRVIERRFDGGMPTEAARKDSALALEMARSRGVPLFAIQAADSVYQMALASGLGRLDYSAITKLWEEWRTQSNDQ